MGVIHNIQMAKVRSAIDNSFIHRTHKQYMVVKNAEPRLQVWGGTECIVVVLWTQISGSKKEKEKIVVWTTAVVLVWIQWFKSSALWKQDLDSLDCWTNNRKKQHWSSLKEVQEKSKLDMLARGRKIFETEEDLEIPPERWSCYSSTTSRQTTQKWGTE